MKRARAVIRAGYSRRHWSEVDHLLAMQLDVNLKSPGNRLQVIVCEFKAGDPH